MRRRDPAPAAPGVELFLILPDLPGLQVALDQELIGREDLRVDLGPGLRVLAMPGLPRLRGHCCDGDRREGHADRGDGAGDDQGLRPVAFAAATKSGLPPGVDLAAAATYCACGAFSRMSGISGPFGPRGIEAAVRHQPRFVTEDMVALRHAALEGVGIVQMPAMAVVDMLPDRAPPSVWERTAGNDPAGSRARCTIGMRDARIRL